MKKSIVKVVWWMYIVLLFIVVVIKFRGSFSKLALQAAATPVGMNCNLVPFATLRAQLANFNEGWVRYNFFGNILSFVPFGVLLPLAYERTGTAARVAGIGFVSILAAELFQLFTVLGSFDVDDIILNMAGVMAGYFVMKAIKGRRIIYKRNVGEGEELDDNE